MVWGSVGMILPNQQFQDLSMWYGKRPQGKTISETVFIAVVKPMDGSLDLDGSKRRR